MFYEPSKGHGLPHDPAKAIVAPRPIGWISTLNRAGEINLAPYSFFNAVSTRPFIVWFSSEGEKDSVSFAQETGEFVANLVGRDLAEKMNYTSVNAPRGVNEFVYADLAMAPSRLVGPPRVAAAPAALECRVTESLSSKGAGRNADQCCRRRRRSGRRAYRRRFSERRPVRHHQGRQCRSSRLHGLCERQRGLFDAPTSLGQGITLR